MLRYGHPTLPDQHEGLGNIEVVRDPEDWPAALGKVHTPLSRKCTLWNDYRPDRE
jgi:hypothetical protein